MTNKRKKKKFDAVSLMCELREKINKEIAGMSPDQLIEYFGRAKDLYEKEMANR